ncbi:GGDEF domain-containing protein [Desulfotomaculum defluvii]
MIKQFPTEIIDIILEEASVGITLVDEKGNVTWFNNQACLLLGWSNEEESLNTVLKCHSQELNNKVIDKINHVNTREWHSVIKLNGRFIENVYTPIQVKDRFTGVMIITKDVTEREKMVEVIKKASVTDNLTGLYNRRFFDTVFNELIANQKPFGIIMADINGLKYTNDNYGHEAGDKLIIQAAENLTQSVRKADYVFRFGGDEFVVLICEDNPDAITAICSRIKEKNILPKPNSPIGVNLSIGFCSSSEVNEVKEIFTYADQKMYQDKRRFYQYEGKFIKRDMPE